MSVYTAFKKEKAFWLKPLLTEIALQEKEEREFTVPGQRPAASQQHPQATALVCSVLRGRHTTCFKHA
jgi:hypothetical protein